MNPSLTTSPTVSVVIPTCGRGAFLAEAIQSALDQTWPIHEVIVVDDASEEDPSPVIAGFGERVRLIRLEKRSGANIARNVGIEAASGTYVGLLDDDDLWMPEKTQIQLDAMAQEKQACTCNRLTNDEAAAPPKRGMPIEERLRFTTPCGTSGLLASREILLAEPFDPELKRHQDWDIFVRLARRGVLAHVEKPLYRWRVGHTSITSQIRNLTPEQIYERAAATHKHREWLGETAYRRRLARSLLSYISQRDDKMVYLASAVHHAGWRAIATVAYERIAMKIGLR